MRSNSEAISDRWQSHREQKAHQEQVIQADKCWEQIEITLKSDLSYSIIDGFLRHYGVTLADFDPKGYNDSRLPETATGQ